jgi:hypothetical protein
MIIEESKCRILNNDEESEEDVSMPLIMRSHPFRTRSERITAVELHNKQSTVEIKKSLDSNAPVGC